MDNNIYRFYPGEIQNLAAQYEEYTTLRDAMIFEYLSHGIYRTDAMNARELAGAFLLGDSQPDIDNLTEQEKHMLAVDERPETLEAVRNILAVVSMETEGV